jgi:hypothetical protein
MGIDFMFIGYGHLRDNTAVFLVQNCPELFEWMLKRWEVYSRYLRQRQQAPKDELPSLGHEVKQYWCKGTIPWHVRELYPNEWYKPGFWPPQPKWQMLGYSIDQDYIPEYHQEAQRYSPSGRVDPEIFERAVGSIWKRVGIELYDDPELEPEEMKDMSLADDPHVHRHIEQLLRQKMQP